MRKLVLVISDKDVPVRHLMNTVNFHVLESDGNLLNADAVFTFVDKGDLKHEKGLKDVPAPQFENRKSKKTRR